MILNNLFMNALSMSLAASFTFFMILLAHKILDKKVEISKLSLLWIIFVITLIIPINFSSNLSIKNYLDFSLNDKKQNIELVYVQENLEILNNFDKIKNENRNNIQISVIPMAWFIVSIILILKDVKIYSDIGKEKSFNSNIRLNKILNNQKEKLNIKKDIQVMIQDKVKLPSLYGMTNIKILVSKEILKLEDEEIEMIFLHELLHYKKLHHISYLILKGLENIYWFNPIIKLAGKFIREDFEYIVDDEILKVKYNRIKYSKTILKTIDFDNLKNINLLPGIYENKTSLERRFRKMKSQKGNSKYSIIFVIVAIITVSMITIAFASEKVEKQKENNKIEITNIDDNQNDLEEVITLVKPLDNIEITANFGERVHPITGEKTVHSGIDLKAEKGDSIYAVMDGEVQMAEFDNKTGNTVKIKHKDGMISTYAHGSKILVSKGDIIEAGDTIMEVGSTGMATGTHLHFEMETAEAELVNVNMMFE